MTPKDPAEKYSGDVFLYYGGISRSGYSRLSDKLESVAKKKEKVCLILVTYGGDPNAGYRMARALSHYYKNIEILIPDVCKSAGTLLCIVANRIIFGDRGELDPLDTQLSKPDEMFENMSGLDIVQALNALETQSFKSFRNYLLDIRDNFGLKTKIAADIAVKLTDGFISPISAKIDPLTLGEHQRALQVALEYGRRLDGISSSLQDDALKKLVGSYPSHGFVIDRKEAKEIFKNITCPCDETIELYSWARSVVESTDIPREPIVINVREYLNNQRQEDEPINTTCQRSGAEQEDSSHEADNDGTEQKSTGNEQADDKSEDG